MEYQYKIVAHLDPDEVCRLVSKYMSLGWCCQGGVFENKGGRFCQAMTKSGEPTQSQANPHD